MSNSPIRARSEAFRRQAGRCYYCNLAMWEADVETFARATGLSVKAALSRQSTAEHLQARCEGGSNASENIVAACRLCNQRRHKGRKKAPAPDAYRAHVRRRMSLGRWHWPQVLKRELIPNPALQDGAPAT